LVSLAEKAQKRLPQRSAIEIRDDISVEAEADRSALLGHDHDDGVGLLGDAEGGAVPRPEGLIERLDVRHREKHASFDDAEIADDDGAIVELVDALRHEEAHEQLALYGRIDDRPLAHDEFVQVGVLLETDERAHAMAGKLGRCRDDLVDDPRLLVATDASEKGASSDAHETATDVVLKDHDDDEDDRRRRQERRQHVVQRRQPRVSGEDVDDQDHGKTEAHLHRAGAAQDEERAVDDVGNERQIDDVDQDLQP
jgi:hypothetical protein